MPKHSVFLVRCALLWFLVGVGLGVAMLLSRADLGWSGVWPMRPVSLLHAAGIALLVHSLWPRIQSIEVLRGERS